jgi:acyl-CoA synthetase (NDP forming)
LSRNLTPLLHPKSIAFIGGSECDVAIRRTRELGFTGKIWAVHPKRETLGGIACVRSVADIDGAPDAAFVAIKREPTIEIVRELRKKGCDSPKQAMPISRRNCSRQQMACRSWAPIATDS